MGGYLSGEFHLPFPQALLTVIILVSFSGVCLLGIRDSSALALTIQTIHLTTMLALAISAMVRWGINGNLVLSANWNAAQPPSAAEIAKEIFFGVSVGFLAYTGCNFPKQYIDDRFRVDAELCRGGSTRRVSQSIEKPLDHVFFPVDLDDVAGLGGCSIRGNSIVSKQHSIDPRPACHRREVATLCRGHGCGLSPMRKYTFTS